jgi:hypothetical protein
LYMETYILIIESLLIHVNLRSSIGELLWFNLEYIHIHCGTTRPYLSPKKHIQYIQENYLSGLHNFVMNNELEIHVTDLWTPKVKREGDKVLMDIIYDKDIHRLPSSNNWRLFYQVNTVSDLATANGY